ncbi:hypothetical protein F0562_035994 [Nyssa sinensis]|uniref:DUF3741 domain-containing protein n=1 Tax=Nyssa sinensis TaxID=561372 RepID=A0A5J5AEI7_9ASTE|nr:hypothetical protein F0562_035994 [Nyssa sinensis]
MFSRKYFYVFYCSCVWINRWMWKARAYLQRISTNKSTGICKFFNIPEACDSLYNSTNFIMCCLPRQLNQLYNIMFIHFTSLQIGSKPAISQRSHGARRSLSIEESSKQIVPFGRGQNSKQVDLSMALAFALENGVKLHKMDTSGNSTSMLSYLHQIGRRTLDNGKMERRSSFDMQRSSSSRFPTFSHLHIEEISKGAQKLNQILRACSNGLNFDRYSIEIGKELLKGAIDLEESLRMLVNLQEASEYMISPQKKNKNNIRLLEEDEDDEEDAVEAAEQKQLDRPRFSFDKPSRNSHGIREVAKTDLKQKLMAITYSTEAPKFPGKEALTTSNLVPHKRSANVGPDFKTLTAFFEPKNHTSSSQSKQEKGRLSNVIAKLMGLELPENIDLKTTRKESSSKQQERTVLKKTAHASTKNAELKTRNTENLASLAIEKNVKQANEIPLIWDNAFVLKAEKIQATRNASFEKLVPDGKSQRKDLERANRMNPMSGSKKATFTTEGQQSNISQLNQITGSQKDFQQKERGHDNTKHNEPKGMEKVETRKPVLKDEQQQKSSQKYKSPEAANKLQEKIGSQESTLQTEKRNAYRLHPSTKQKPRDDHGLHQPHMLRKHEPQEEKNQTEKIEQQNAKQKLPVRKQKGSEVESNISLKPMQNATSSLKKQPHMNQAALSKRSSTKAIDVRQWKGLSDSRQQEDPVKDGSSINLKVNTNKLMNGNSYLNASPEEIGWETEKGKGSIPPVMEEKPDRLTATEKKVDSMKVHRSEAPRKIDEVVTRRNGTSYNFARPLKHQISILQEKKQKRHDKISGSQVAEQVSVNRSKEAPVRIMRSNKTEASIQSLNRAQQFHNEAEHAPTLYSSGGDECQSPKVPHNFIPNDSSQNITAGLSTVSIDLQGQEPAFIEVQELISHKTVSCPLNGANKESMELTYLLQHEDKKIPTSGTQELLTENETRLKQILMKSQLFLDTAEALFKLNIPVSILHASDYYSQDEESKLILDCGYEVMKRKGRRQECAVHPFEKISISSVKVRSLDDLVKQLYKDFESLKFYGRNGGDECDGAEYLHKMLERDVQIRDLDVNSMWDFGWNEMMFAFPEKGDIIRDVEKHVLNGLIDEITKDLLHVSVFI